MPIVRTFQCQECGWRKKITLTAEQWSDPAPSCSRCDTYDIQMQQEFKPPTIVGSHRARAVKLAETIAAEDYGVADMKVEGKEGHTPTVRYKDDNRQSTAKAAFASANREMLEGAAALGRATRLQHGNPLDAIKTLPNYIANSKRLSIKGY